MLQPTLWSSVMEEELVAKRKQHLLRASFALGIGAAMAAILLFFPPLDPIYLAVIGALAALAALTLPVSLFLAWTNQRKLTRLRHFQFAYNCRPGPSWEDPPS